MSKSLNYVALDLVKARAAGLMVGEGLHKAAHDMLLKRLRAEVVKMEEKEQAQRVIDEALHLEGDCKTCRG